MLWGDIAEAKAAQQEKRDRHHENKIAFGSCLPVELCHALEALEKFVDDKGIEGVHGPLIDLIDCKPDRVKAVEVRAGRLCARLAAVNQSCFGLQCFGKRAQLFHAMQLVRNTSCCIAHVLPGVVQQVVVSTTLSV